MIKKVLRSKKELQNSREIIDKELRRGEISRNFWEIIQKVSRNEDYNQIIYWKFSRIIQEIGHYNNLEGHLLWKLHGVNTICSANRKR